MIKSYGKINLSLRVIKKLKNGLHNIQSNVMLINIHDEIKIFKINKRKDIVNFIGKFKGQVDKQDNTIFKTLKLLKKKKFIKKDYFYKIIINKKIPVFSGLGGGSSNSAFLIKYFLKDKVKKKIINLFEKKIGTDLNLFFYKQCFQKSLYKISQYKKNFNFYLIVIFPNVKCSTKLIYSKVKDYSNPTKIDFSKLRDKKSYIHFISKEVNDLEKISTKKFSILKKTINFISKQKNCYFSRMTGSGSACFGVFKTKSSAKLALRNVKKEFPKFWCVLTKTF